MTHFAENNMGRITTGCGVVHEKFSHAENNIHFREADKMGRRLRIQGKNQLYLVENITIQHAYLFAPDDEDEVNALIAGALARAAQLCEVKIVACIFLLNRFKLLLSAPKLNLPKFMKAFQGQAARALNRHFKRHGKFFEARYTKADVLDAEGALQAFKEVACAPIIAGLVENLEDWTGISTLDSYLRGQVFEAEWLNRTLYAKLLKASQRKRNPQKLPENAGIEKYTFKLHRLPGFEHQTQAEHRTFIEQELANFAEEVRKENRKQGVTYLGRQKIRALTWRDHPEEYAAFGQRSNYGSEAARARHCAEYQAIAKQYAVAMEAYMKDDDAAKFPPYSIRPSAMDCELPRKRPTPAKDTESGAAVVSEA